jgi:UTP--glucose-1-phosphate uridylyltransferase
MPKPVRKAVFPVAGLGTRFLPVTKAMPKEMLPIVDKPLIQYAVEEAQEAGIEEFIFVTGRAKSAIEDHFDHSIELELNLRERGATDALRSVLDWMPEPGHISYTRQQSPLGLGHAVWCARTFISDEPFAVLLADDLILGTPGALKQMIEAHRSLGGNLLAIEEVPPERTRSYGILDPVSDDGRIAEVKGLVEKPDPSVAPSNLGIIGRYILQPIVLTILEHQGRGAGSEIQLTDALAKTIGLVPFHGMRFEGQRFDCGSKIGYLEANVAFALQRPDMNGSVRTMLEKYLAPKAGHAEPARQTSPATRSAEMVRG